MSDMPVVKDQHPGMRKSMTGMPEKTLKPIQNKDSIVTSDKMTSKFNSLEPAQPSQTTSNVARQYVDEVIAKADEIPSQTTSNVARQYVDEVVNRIADEPIIEKAEITLS